MNHWQDYIRLQKKQQAWWEYVAKDNITKKEQNVK
jgi:hypothetical protein